MLEEAVVKHCSPTLAGIKTGNLFSCQYKSKREINNHIRKLNQILIPKGLRIMPLRYSEGRALIYVFRPAKLNRDLGDYQVFTMLQERGYQCREAGKCLMRLIERLKEGSEFPHEIGLFLGYPPEDVKAFIENKGRHCKCIGCWKVYGDEEGARRLFARYQKCTHIYYKKWTQGHSIQQLAVAV